ncbi:MAG: hypothetical protein CMI53_04500, partial [Parcubacteria group bacterium]|nr:hypothetical protein [Parcubacteria group bacterium]
MAEPARKINLPSTPPNKNTSPDNIVDFQNYKDNKNKRELRQDQLASQREQQAVPDMSNTDTPNLIKNPDVNTDVNTKGNAEKRPAVDN